MVGIWCAHGRADFRSGTTLHSLVSSAGGAPERVPAPCGSCLLWWPAATVAVLTPAKVRRDRLVATDAAGVRRVPRTLRWVWPRCRT